MKVYDADNVELSIGGKPASEYRSTEAERAIRRLPDLTFKMRLRVEPDFTRTLLAELRRKERNRRKREKRARRGR